MTPGERAARDRQLFDATAAALCAKDLAPASAVARRHRLLQSLKALPGGTVPRVLEVGCGAGFAATYLAGRYESFVGIDHSAELIRLARRHNGRESTRFVVADAAEFTDDEPFDGILMIGVLHHMEELETTLRHLVGLLRPGGFLLANEPQPANPLISAARRLRSTFDAHYSAEQEELPAARLVAALEAAGLDDLQVLPQGLFSTPFAEVVLPPQWLIRHLAGAACAVDAVVEGGLGRLLRPLSWNLIAVGRRPAGGV